MNLLDFWRGMDVRSDHFEQIKELGNFTDGGSFSELPERERLARGAALAVHWEALADEAEQSRLVRAQFGRWTPEEMRRMATEYRAGRDPHA